MAVVDFLPFGIDPGANVISQADYLALGTREDGFASGLAKSNELNKVWRQSSVMAAAVATWISETLDDDVLDNGDVPAIVTQFNAAIGTKTRIKMTGNLTLYVATTGNDSTNNGLSPGAPFATWQRAWNEIFNKYDLQGWNVTINIADGTYTTPVFINGTPSGTGNTTIIRFTGNTVTPSAVLLNVTNAAAIVVGPHSIPRLQVEGCKIQASGAATLGHGYGISNSQATVFINRVDFGLCTSGHMVSAYSGIIHTSGEPYYISGGSHCHIDCYNAGTVVTVGSTVVLSGTPAFSYFVKARFCAGIQLYSTVWSGAALGARYYCETNGCINTGGAGINYFPGNAPGTVISGGQYL